MATGTRRRWSRSRSAVGWKPEIPEKDLRFDKDREVHGPVAVAVALERKVKDKDQRVVVVGTSQFLSNQFIGLLSNLDLGTNMLNWLSQDENLITVQPRARVDSQLNLGRTGLALIGLGFLLLLPAAFLVDRGYGLVAPAQGLTVRPARYDEARLDRQCCCC